MPNELRVGLTMREVHPTGYTEPRDALARAWGAFMEAALPEAAWLPVPNLGAGAAPRFCERWGINALILTGGEDIGVAPARDATERSLWQHFLRARLPVFGVCRGLQLMWTELGGTLAETNGHVAVRHGVRVAHPAPSNPAGSVREVNSFHTLSLREADTALRAPFTVIARADDGSLEGIRLCDAAVAGVMWHPEREAPPNLDDIALVRALLGLDQANGEQRDGH
jgi:N5-(cytidine 5'-diphosphoramidyl)-L-glutamine hydrolase